MTTRPDQVDITLAAYIAALDAMTAAEHELARVKQIAALADKAYTEALREAREAAGTA